MGLALIAAFAAYAQSMPSEVGLPPFSVAATFVDRSYVPVGNSPNPNELLASAALYREIAISAAMNANKNHSALQRQADLWQRESTGDFRGHLVEAFGAEQAKNAVNRVQYDCPMVYLFDAGVVDRLGLDEAQRRQVSAALEEPFPKPAKPVKPSYQQWRSGCEARSDRIAAILNRAQKLTLESLADCKERRPAYPSSPLMGRSNLQVKLRTVKFLRPLMPFSPAQEQRMSECVADWLKDVETQFAWFEQSGTYFDVGELRRRMAAADDRFVRASDPILDGPLRQRFDQIYFQLFAVGSAFADGSYGKALGVTDAQRAAARAGSVRRNPQGSTPHPLVLISGIEDARMEVLTDAQRRLLREKSGAELNDAQLLVVRWQLSTLNRPKAWAQPDPQIIEKPASK